MAISNRRLVALEDGRVSFRYKDYARGGRHRTMTLEAPEFLRRFTQHVLPSGFVRIRSYGLLANRHRRAKVALCRELLGVPAASTIDPPSGLTGLVRGITPTRDAATCPACGAGRMVLVAELPPSPGRRGPGERPIACPTFDTS